MLNIADLHFLHKLSPADEKSLILAIFFHDIIYNPPEKDSELKSIDIFNQFARELKIADVICCNVRRMIESTIVHTLDVWDHPLNHIFLDLDLSILGAQPLVYENYSKAIRKEYEHYTDYQSSRIVVLNKFLNRKTLYFTDLFRNLFEELARNNITNEIKLLSTATQRSIILSGGPSSVYDDGAPHLDHAIFSLNVPVLGICYGVQDLVWSLGGKVESSKDREYGEAQVDISTEHKLFHGVQKSTTVWMSHGDLVSRLPNDFIGIASTNSSPYAAISHITKPIFGVQFHPEVTHTVEGKIMIKNFINICNCNHNWNMESFINVEIKRIQEIVGGKHVVGAVSGGVDSTVAGVLLNRAIGKQFHPILVDNGLLRKDEAIQVKDMFSSLNIDLTVVNASKLFLDRLAGVSDPEKKRKIIGNSFINVFEEEAKKLDHVEFLLQGTLYPDVIESISYKGPSHTIKTHHNVGGLLADMKLKLIEPLRELFKDEVRHLGTLLGIGHDIVHRHPFPGPGLGIRILGPVTIESLEILKQVDAIYLEEIRMAGLYDSIGQAFSVLLPVKSVGVMGDQRTYEQVVALRAVSTTDFMTADWFPMPYDVLKKISHRIINQVRGVNRVTYDISSKPPSTIEWE